MKKLLFLLSVLSLNGLAYGQISADSLVRQGVDLHDRGYYEEALVKYDSALLQDKDHYMAIYEKSYTLMELKKYNDCIQLSQYLLREHKGNKNNPSVYINYGTCLDYLGQPREAVAVFNEGLKEFPNVSLLYYNKAITLLNINETAEGLRAVELALVNNPGHASSHSLLAQASFKGNKVLSLMATCAFLAIEPQGQRAKASLAMLEEMLGVHIKKNGNNAITVTIPSDQLDKKPGANPDYYGPTELLMALQGALNADEKFARETPAERMERNLKSVIASLQEGRKEGTGFGWEFYVPFLCELQDKNYLSAYCHLIYLSSGDTDNAQWLKDHKDQVEAFFQWMDRFKWAAPKV